VSSEAGDASALPQPRDRCTEPPVFPGSRDAVRRLSSEGQTYSATAAIAYISPT
jgi:hypothetical protein